MTSIDDLKEKIKWQRKFFVDRAKNLINGDKIPEAVFLLVVFLLVSTLAFSLGRLSAYEKKKEPISVIKTEEYYKWNGIDSTSADISNNLPASVQQAPTTQKGNIVASKSGTKYYFTWCSGVARINEANKIWFNTVEEARARGLTPATGCEGLK